MGAGKYARMMRRRGGVIPPNICGTGQLFPPGWKFLHSEISGGLGSWGNMLKVFGFNNLGATVVNVTDGTLSVCYENGEIDKYTLDSFFTEDARVTSQFDQFELNQLVSSTSTLGYIKSDNDLNRGFTDRNVSAGPPAVLINGALGSLQNDSPRTVCMVVDYPSTPTVNEAFGPLRFPSSIGADFWTWSGNNVSLIMRMNGPNQGYFYNGLRSAGTKLIIWTYDGTSPINRSGMQLYWNGNTTPETPDGIYNSGAPSSQVISGVQFGSNTSSAFYKELDIFDFAFGPTEIAAALECYEQLYTFS
jgi:hypothetical protein